MHRAVKPLLPFAQRFSDAGFELYLVGGAVRSMLLKKQPVDFDFATNATPRQVKDLFRRVIPTGEAHGTVTVIFRGSHYEVTTYRTETAYSDGRHPDTVTFASSIEEDLSRRDFTVNAIALRLPSGETKDPFSGREDLRNGIIRAIGDPAERFAEDGLRLMRAIRFATQLDFAVDEATFEAIGAEAHRLEVIARERVRDELQKILLSDRPSRGLSLLEETRLLNQIIPELSSSRGKSQGSDSTFDLFEHSLEVVRFTPAELDLRLAALFHDLAKAWTREESEDGRLAFPDHDKLSAEVAERRMEELRFPRKTIAAVSTLVRHHMFSYSSEQGDASIRRMVSRLGAETIFRLITLRRADVAGKRGRLVAVPQMDELEDRLKRVLSQDAALSRKDLAVNGKDLMNAGIPKGPKLGLVLDELLETVLDDPEMNSPEKLLPLGMRIYRERLEE
ncbi:MAG: CCA tRNA nucleotidyltransferase [Alkalispirochaetaceae bacterium]